MTRFLFYLNQGIHRKFLIILLGKTLLLMASCNYSGDMGRGYFYLSDEEAGDVGYPYGSMLYKSSQELFYERILIYSNISKITFDNQYILIYQQPNIMTMRRILKDEMDFWQRNEAYRKLSDTLIKFPHGVESYVKLKKLSELGYSYGYIADSLLRSVPYYQKLFANSSNYWIINKYNDSLIGPLTKSEFEVARKKLKMPDKLKLD